MAETSGNRSVGSGTMAGELGGFCWLASPSGAPGGLALHFHSSLVSPKYYNTRGSGFPLRCIQEFTLHDTDRIKPIRCDTRKSEPGRRREERKRGMTNTSNTGPADAGAKRNSTTPGRKGQSPAKSRLRGACPVNSVTHWRRENGRGRRSEIRAALSPVMTNQSATGFATNGIPCRIQQAVTSYPASGNRSVGSGTMANEGSNGYNWSASPNNATNGLNLNFNSGNVNPQNNNNRGNGFPLRCIQEFALPQTKCALWKRRDRTC